MYSIDINETVPQKTCDLQFLYSGFQFCNLPVILAKRYAALPVIYRELSVDFAVDEQWKVTKQNQFCSIVVSSDMQQQYVTYRPLKIFNMFESVVTIIFSYYCKT